MAAARGGISVKSRLIEDVQPTEQGDTHGLKQRHRHCSEQAELPSLPPPPPFVVT